MESKRERERKKEVGEKGTLTEILSHRDTSYRDSEREREIQKEINIDR